MIKYGFQGLDLDWEYPGDTDGGGRELQDTRNFPVLLREMRAAYGKDFGSESTPYRRRVLLIEDSKRHAGSRLLVPQVV